jgi:ATP-dependent exoDNAse (exonuclease V) beta subunit
MQILAPNLLILASAGTGKTYQLSNRIIGLIARGVAPEQIVALTFTRKAAAEFADRVLTRLAAAASNPAAAEHLRAELGVAEADFAELLERVVRALPRTVFGTIDSFFAKVVRGFQYELGLTGGTFDMLEGPRAAAAKDELLAMLLSEPVRHGGGEFFHAFRRVMIGREEQKVVDKLRGFISTWHAQLRSGDGREWGPATLANAAVEDWEANKAGLVAQIDAGLDCLTYTQKSQRAALEKFVSSMAAHTVGSNLLREQSSGMLDKLIAALASPAPQLDISHYKPLCIDGQAGRALREALVLLANCEMAAACARTAAVRDVVGHYDELCETQLRRRARLGFDDVKFLMGQWCRSEDGRLRRERVDFRLDARYAHWLLDEFQDTSRRDWDGLLPLLDEAASAGAGAGGLFIVGDRKQAIYGWRGGEVGLFDVVTERFAGGLTVEEMACSERSCPAVLELVNRVCGDTTTMRNLFGAASADQWHWQEHVSSVRVLNQAGEACVEVLANKGSEALGERLVALLGELEVGQRALTCGVLVRKGSEVREIADRLRLAGFDVIEEGARQPARDNPVGIAIWQLLRWLADPSDDFAKRTLEMSPLGVHLLEQHASWARAWERLHARAAGGGFGAVVEQLVEDLWHEWSPFGRRRASELVATLAAMDAGGAASARVAADLLGELEVSQSPGVAAVQVMTIHKSKGLGFDVVVIPGLSNDNIPAANYFEVAEGDGWLSAPPPQWVRQVLPELRAAEERWANKQRYEALCTLYVALTRAKRGLYVLLEPAAESAEGSRASWSNWIRSSLGNDSGVIFSAGTRGWTTGVARLAAGPAPAEVGVRRLGRAVARRERTTPSALGVEVHVAARAGHSPGGMRIGTEVHAAFESVGWIDEERPALPAGEAGARVAGLLEVAGLRGLFERRGRSIDLLREQPVEAIIGGRWLSGVVDRLHLHRDPAGNVVVAEVIDFKTDAVVSAAELVARHAGQMGAYRTVLEMLFPGAAVRCLLVSTKLAQLIEVPSAAGH